MQEDKVEGASQKAHSKHCLLHVVGCWGANIMGMHAGA